MGRAMDVDILTIVLLTVIIALLAGALAWYGPRRRHWQTHPGDKDRRQERDDQGTPDEGEWPR